MRYNTDAVDNYVTDVDEMGDLEGNPEALVETEPYAEEGSMETVLPERDELYDDEGNLDLP